jgi:hypothetical protein
MQPDRQHRKILRQLRRRQAGVRKNYAKQKTIQAGWSFALAGALGLSASPSGILRFARRCFSAAFPAAKNADAAAFSSRGFESYLNHCKKIHHPVGWRIYLAGALGLSASPSGILRFARRCFSAALPCR